MTTTPTAPSFSDIDVSNWASLEPHFRELIDRPIDSAGALHQWVMDLTALCEIVWEYGSRRNIENACHTDDEAVEQAYMHYVREIQPRLQPVIFEIQKKYLANEHHAELTAGGYDMMLREWRTDVEQFREKNIPLDTQITELATQYGKIMGAMTVEFRGETCTLPQLARFLEETDRPTRREAWEASVNRRMLDGETVEDIFEKLLKLRHEMAINADSADFRDYMWLARKRFDYTPADCLSFGDAVEAVCMPRIRALDKQRREALKLEALRPWDTSVDVRGRSPLRPFDPKDIAGFVEKTRKLFDRISPELGRQFDSLREHGDLDLESRLGKRPGGFQASLEASKRPFIFMNAAGVQHDVETLVHEGGHAFHYLASRSIPNVFVRHAPLEFCEVASMSMETIASDHYDLFYADEATAARAKRRQLEGLVRMFPWIATIDGFQHWLYTHPGHSRDERTAAWLDLQRRFASDVIDWTGYEQVQRTLWHRQVHLFSYPFYYIEYGIAQLGALGVWLNYKRDPKTALAKLLDAFALGGTVPLPTLFETAGVKFQFTRATLEPLIAAVETELAALPV
ncbi:MAG: M3 family oligoendopeptidase [Planctomycetes bacterium]|nr:M3 family oligoendopeptidase [Planctomycetota bacterium]